MIDTSADRVNKLRYSWPELIALSAAFIGAIICLVGSLAFYVSQIQFSGPSQLWPLPGMVLLWWALLGVFGFIAVYLAVRQTFTGWLHASIFLTGAFLPLVILGAFSIGIFVLIGFLFFLVSMLILALRKRAKLLESFGLFILGAICNLGLLYLMITLGRPAY